MAKILGSQKVGGVKQRKSTKQTIKKSKSSDWVQKRGLLFRPERYKYVRKLIHSGGCVFCEAYKLGINKESLVLYHSDYVMVMLNKFPYNSGHLLVLPTRHCGKLLELNDEEYFDLQLQLRLAVKAVMECYNPTGCNLGLNHGKAAGAGLPDHLHWHVVPRWSGDTNFFPIIAETKVLAETLDQTYAKLSPYFIDKSDKK
ncbi:MAG: HIT domain-containing protein [Bdellovibrionales bacterium]|nr:HIT domain-containing protein [Bdellovibrionales bacterium]